MALARRCRRLLRGLIPPMTRRRQIVTGALLMALGLVLAVVVPSPYVDLARVVLTELDELDLAPYGSVLVLAPHADDETLGAGGLLMAAQRAGLQAHVVVATNGDGYLTATMRDFQRLFPTAADFRRMGTIRQQETLAAVGLLGLDDAQVLFLSYPDRGLLPMLRQYWEHDRPLRSSYIGASSSPYPLTYNPAATYSGADLLADLTAILREERPDLVVIPHPVDEHPDHRALAAFARLALATLQEEAPAYRPDVLAYPIHSEQYPFPPRKGLNLGAMLLPPPALAQVSEGWVRLSLSEEDAVRKYLAIGAYRSQYATLRSLLEAFARANEVFVPVETARPLVALAEGEPFRPDTWLSAEGEPLEAVLYDPLADQSLRRRLASADLEAVYASRQEGDRLVVCSQLRGRRVRTLSYQLSIVAAGAEGVAHYSAWSGYNQTDPEASQSARDMVCEQVPLAALGDPRLMALSVEARMPGGALLDSSGWVLLEAR